MQSTQAESQADTEYAESSFGEVLRHKIDSREAVVGVIGLGYVGLPLSLEFSRELSVIGYDVDERKVDSLNKHESYVLDIENSALRRHVGKSLHPTTDAERMRECDFIIVCVPTPLKENLEPDLSYIVSAAETIRGVLREGQFVILESTTYPGTTDEVLLRVLRETGLEPGVHFGLAYSPERVDPGNTKHPIRTVPKIVGGFNPECTGIASQLYSTVFDVVHPVSDMKTAEAAKILENIFRNVNIALINELSLVFTRLGIDTWEVIEAAS
ncbi:nucleotide sugar dehydrogenase, partial [Candidatus Bathyarchaeota archaeon]|nr:nucleotide sugar dehydrogenase [Candidatus Bathyarchaeota archaeon]